MKPILRYQSQLLYRRSYKANWKFKPAERVKVIVFRPNRAGPTKKVA